MTTSAGATASSRADNRRIGVAASDWPTIIDVTVQQLRSGHRSALQSRQVGRGELPDLSSGPRRARLGDRLVVRMRCCRHAAQHPQQVRISGRLSIGTMWRRAMAASCPVVVGVDDGLLVSKETGFGPSPPRSRPRRRRRRLPGGLLDAGWSATDPATRATIPGRDVGAPISCSGSVAAASR